MGIFIDLEGLDGSGKTTQTELICKRLKDDGIDYRQIKLPDYESDSSILVRKYLAGDFGKNAGDVNAYAASVLYAADRFASYTEKWGEDYRSGKLIFADRYTPANALYQMTKLDKADWDPFLQWLFDFEYEKIGIPAPDKVIFLDMPVEVSQRLMTSRYNGDESKKDVHEANVEFLNACREAALYAADKYGWSVVECAENGEPLPIDVINDKVYKILLDALK
ncbi:MAG: thymidylate kinase [Ruminococcaceae bacterium]|nr:thymidylate kinase [Oscillospiraceae bacterium]